MPRLPVDGTKVIEHRITFGTKERQLLDDLVQSKTVEHYTDAFENVATPVVALMNDVTGMIVFLTALAAVGVTGVAFAFAFSVSRADDVASVIDAFLTQREQALIAAGGNLVTPPGFGWLWRWLSKIFEIGYQPSQNGTGGGGGGGGGFHPAYQTEPQPTWSGTGIPDVGR